MNYAGLIPLGGLPQQDVIDDIRALYENTVSNSVSQRVSALTEASDSRYVDRLPILLVYMNSIALMPINSKTLPPYYTEKHTLLQETITADNLTPAQTTAFAGGREVGILRKDVVSTTSKYQNGFKLEASYGEKEEGIQATRMMLEHIAAHYTKHLGFQALTKMITMKKRLPSQPYYDTQDVFQRREMLYKEVYEYGVANKSPNGLLNAIRIGSETLSRANNYDKPDSVYFPYKMMSIVRGTQEYTSYDKTGAVGQKRAWGSSTPTVTTIDGIDLFGMDTDVMEDNTLFDTCERLGSQFPFKLYPDQNPDAGAGWYIYDESQDDRVFRSLDDIMSACPFFTGDAAGYTPVADFDYDAKFLDWADRNAPKTALQFFQTNAIIGVNPLQIRRMSGLLLAISGDKTGLTIIGKPRVSSGEEVTTQTTNFSYRQGWGIHIADDKRFTFLRNIMFGGPVQGANTKALEREEILEMANNGWTTNELNRASLYLIPVKKSLLKDDPKCISLLDDPNPEVRECMTRHVKPLMGMDNVESPYDPANGVGHFPATDYLREGIGYYNRQGVFVWLPGMTHLGPKPMNGHAYTRKYGTDILNSS